jgi:2-phospho-L-lactate transferase/gluconeogenesis factor (CofD/UPF0052 family)
VIPQNEIESEVLQSSSNTNPGRDSSVKVVLFSGGSGTGSIASSLLRNRQVSLTVIINAYDDGHSTGRLRRFMPGMLGPSDVRKNINRMMPRSQERHTALLFLSDYRLPKGYPFDAGMKLVKSVAEGATSELPDVLAAQFDRLSVKQARTFRQYFARFHEYAERETENNNCFDFNDCALGNILFAGCFLAQDRDFNRAITDFSEFFEIQGRILNVTLGENLFLMARTEAGSIIRGEAELVSVESASRISELFLVEEGIYRSRIESDNNLSVEELEGCIQSGRRVPLINPEAQSALQSADLIIYGPGTQHSSLLPSYLTRGVAETIAANRNADKVFISNIRRDVDIQQEDANELAQKFLRAMWRNGEVSLGWNDVVTHFFVQRNESEGLQAPSYIPFDKDAFEFPLTAVTARDWEEYEGRHAGGYVMQELSRIIECRIGASFESSRHMVSIIVPALNEVRTVAETLRRLTAVDFHNFDLGREIIFVDGGSTDGTYEVASGTPGVRVCRLPSKKGRGAALRCGLDKARGDIVVFFPADLEYLESDLQSIVFSIIRNRFKVVFGTRVIKCKNVADQLKTIYGGDRLAYLVGKYGGILLSTTALLFCNRYVTDTLTSIKGFDTNFLRSLNLKSDGMDLDAEIVAKVARAGEYILEIPVDYKPRTRAQGKKSTTMDGLKTLWALISWRFARLT